MGLRAGKYNMRRVVLVLGAFVLGCLAASNVFAKPKQKGDIRRINFLNATYEAGCAGFRVAVRNGVYAPAQAGFVFHVIVSYGDLTGDGQAEAMVLTQCDGAVQNLSEVRVYTLRRHRLVQLARLETGTKNGGDILAARITGDKLRATRGPGPQNCPQADYAAQEITVYRWRGNRLQRSGPIICKVL